MNNLKDYNVQEIEQILVDMGEKKFRAKQIFKWVHRGVCSFDEMTDISVELRNKLEEKFTLGCFELADFLKSKDGTTKYLFKLQDGNIIECVLMEYHHGNTICISTQVGCRMGCKFCASSHVGFVRDLTAGEMVEEILAVTRLSGQKISNIVLMGIGEPLNNYDSVFKALYMINNSDSLNIGARHISISTSGVVPKILDLANEKLAITLSISLHAPNDAIRESMMPVNKKYNIATLIDACKEYIRITNRRVTFEYALVNGVNDSPEHAYELAALLKGMLCHVNLIPINPIKEGSYHKSTTENTLRFRDILNSRGITATVRRELGSDIEAACGQLRRKYISGE